MTLLPFVEIVVCLIARCSGLIYPPFSCCFYSFSISRLMKFDLKVNMNFPLQINLSDVNLKYSCSVCYDFLTNRVADVLWLVELFFSSIVIPCSRAITTETDVTCWIIRDNLFQLFCSGICVNHLCWLHQLIEVSIKSFYSINNNELWQVDSNFIQLLGEWYHENNNTIIMFNPKPNMTHIKKNNS